MLEREAAKIGVNLYSLTMREFCNIRIAYWEKEEQKQRSEWERTRWQAALLLTPHSKKAVQPKDIVRFPWEGSSLEAIKKAHEQGKMNNPNYDKIFPDRI